MRRVWSGWRIPSASRLRRGRDVAHVGHRAPRARPRPVSRSCQVAVVSVRAAPRSARASASRLRTRSGFVRKRGSSTSSGSPTTSQIARNRRSLPPATISSPSAVGNTSYGATIGKRVPSPRRDGAVREVAGEVVADVPDRRLVERHVDDRALAGALALEQRREDAERRPGARALVDQRRADADAGPAGLARDRDQAAGRLHQRVVAGLAGERAGAAVRADRAVDEPRVARADRLRAEPELLGEPGAQALEEDVGAVGQPEQRLARRAGRGARAPSERLPAFAERNIVPSPFQNGGPQARPSSPVSGRSTLTTSAPSAARICAQYGPAIDVVTSSTRTPLRGVCAMRA